MKKTYSFLCAICAALCLISLNGCQKEKQGKTDPPPTADVQTAFPTSFRVSSVEIYNRTGKIQREDLYAVSGAENKIRYSVEYSYDDSGRLTEVKQTGGELGSNRPVETYLYSGDHCTQHVVYDENGSTQKAIYWKYDKDGNLLTERVVTMLPTASGTGYNGKSEEITEYDGKGLAKQKTYAAGGSYSRNEYGYDAEGRRITDNSYYSTDGENYLFLETKAWEYDENGNILRELKKDSSGQPVYSRVFTYDPESHLLSDTVYSSGIPEDDNISTQCKYEYNQDGTCSFAVEFSGNRTIQTYYEYDGGGNCTCISETEYIDGIPQGTTVTRIEYDSRSNPVCEKETDPKGLEKTVFKCEYEYYDDGKIKRKTNYEEY